MPDTPFKLVFCIPYCGLDHPLVQDSLDANSIDPVEEMKSLVEHPTL